MDEKGRIILIVCISIAILLVIALTCFFVFNNKKKKQKGNKLLESIFSYLGGKENIEELSSMGSRLTFKLKDNSKLQKEELKNLGVPSIIFMSNKTTIVIGKSLAQDIDKAYNNK